MKTRVTDMVIRIRFNPRLAAWVASVNAARASAGKLSSLVPPTRPPLSKVIAAKVAVIQPKTTASVPSVRGAPGRQGAGGSGAGRHDR
jgi:hypothetical protein